MTQTKDIKAIGGIGASGWDVRKKLAERIEREQTARLFPHTARSLHKSAEHSWRNEFVAPTSEDE